MREAPEAVVDAVQEQMGCHDHWVCPDAQRIADAAWAVAYPEALRDAAERLDWVKPDVCPCDHPEACCGSEEACDAMQPSVRVIGASDLRRWADESETTATEESL